MFSQAHIRIDLIIGLEHESDHFVNDKPIRCECTFVLFFQMNKITIIFELKKDKDNNACFVHKMYFLSIWRLCA